MVSVIHSVGRPGLPDKVPHGPHSGSTAYRPLFPRSPPKGIGFSAFLADEVLASRRLRGSSVNTTATLNVGTL
jgi:hypothetical protein